MNISDNGDIIEATTATNVDSSDSDIVCATPQKLKKCRKHKLKVKEKNESLEESLKLISRYKVEKTIVGSVNYNKPYIYLNIKEIHHLSRQNSFLKHNNVHVVGFYKFHPLFGQILTDYKKRFCKNNILKTDFKLLNGSPIEDNLISAYGSIEFQISHQKNQPVFIVKFFRTENEGYFKHYIESLKFSRNFVPRCYFEQIQLTSC